MADVANGADLHSAKLPLPHGKRREASQPWYGSGMKAQPRSGALGVGSARAYTSQGTDGEPLCRPAVAADDRLYRYAPVPPVYRDEDGYLLEDGMSQTDRHLTQTTRWFHALKRRLPTATVCSDLPLHYRLDDTDATLVPDLYVALGVPPDVDREDYRLWEDPAPDVVVEMLSRTTAKRDVGLKRHTYERLGIREYWLFDPKGFELSTPLVGYRLRDGRYRRIDADAAGRLRSEALGLDLHVRDGELRFRDPATGEDLRTLDEAEDRAAAEAHRADAETHRADAEAHRADAEAHRADAAEREREAEKRRADAAERELTRLRLRLEEP